MREIGFEEILGVGLGVVVAGTGDDLLGGGNAGGVQGVQGVLPLTHQLGIVDAERHATHQRHHGEDGHQRIVAMPIAAESSDRCRERPAKSIVREDRVINR